MQSFLVVDLLDEALDVLMRFFECGIFVHEDFFVFEGFDEAFGEGIVVTVAYVSHAGFHAQLFESFRVGVAGVLYAMV